MIEFKFRFAEDAMPRNMAGLGAARIGLNKQPPVFSTRVMACPFGGMRS